MKCLKVLRRSIFLLLSFSFSLCLIACNDQSNMSLFPIENYDQTIDHWIKPSDPNFDKPLLDKAMQQKRMEIFYNHYFGISSPWHSTYIDSIIHQNQEFIKSKEQKTINHFSNENKSIDKIGYGENFRPYTNAWIEGIANNIQVNQFSHLSYNKNNRGIATTNLAVRALPTDDVHFYSYKIAGQGYPFDNLQMSSLWVGTPIYIVGTTQDHAWYLIISPSVIGWVKSNGISKVTDEFIHSWATTAKNKLAAITHTQTSLLNKEKRFLVTTYVGTVFPVSTDISPVEMELLVPIADNHDNAVIKKVLISKKNASIMPLTITPHHFSDMMKTLIGRSYGWGGIYLYNDCSAELKSLFTPFGIWLPRHSADQINEGKTVDMSTSNSEQRLSYLMKQGKPFLTIVYIGGHVFLYIGNKIVPQTNSLAAMTYQNIWGLRPNPSVKRVIIGKSVLFPLLLEYPENSNLISLAAKEYFITSDLSELPVSDQDLLQKHNVDINSLMQYQKS